MVKSHKIMEAHMKTLMEINTPTNTPLSLQLYYYTIRTHIRGLATLGKTEDLLDTMLVHVTISSYLFIYAENLLVIMAIKRG